MADKVVLPSRDKTFEIVTNLTSLQVSSFTSMKITMEIAKSSLTLILRFQEIHKNW